MRSDSYHQEMKNVTFRGSLDAELERESLLPCISATIYCVDS